MPSIYNLCQLQGQTSRFEPGIDGLQQQRLHLSWSDGSFHLYNNNTSLLIVSMRGAKMLVRGGRILECVNFFLR